jgi:serine/threonine protein kinase
LFRRVQRRAKKCSERFTPPPPHWRFGRSDSRTTRLYERQFLPPPPEPYPAGRAARRRRIGGGDPFLAQSAGAADPGAAARRFGPEGAPAQFGPYRVERLLGKGGMGQVFLGYDPQLQRRVALKVIRGDYTRTRNWWSGCGARRASRRS